MFLPLRPATRLGIVLFMFASQVLSPALAYAIHGGDNPYPSAALGLNAVYHLLLLAPLMLPMRIGMVHPLVFPLLFRMLKSFIKDPYFIISPFSFLFAEFQHVPMNGALAHYTTAELAAVDLKVTALSIMGLAAYYAGYAWFTPRVRRQRPVQFANAAGPMLLAIIGIVVLFAIFLEMRGGLQAHMTSLAYGRFQALGSVGYLIALLDLPLFALLLWLALRPRAYRSPIFLVGVVTGALMGFLVSGSRGSIMVFIVTLGVLWLMQRRRIPPAAMAAVVMAIPLGLIALGALGTVRSSAWSGGEAEFTAVTALDVKASMAAAQDELERRQYVDGERGVIAEGWRTTGPLWGETYVGGLLFWVPRAIWPEKPRGVGSYYVSRILSPGAEYTVPVGSVGEAFWNFGYPGIVLIMGLWGAFHRWLAATYLVNWDNAAFRVFYLLTLTGAAPTSDAIVRYLQSVVLLAALLLFLQAMNRKRMGRRPSVSQHAAPPLSPIRPRPQLRG